MEKLYHLGFAPEQVAGATYAIICGDPGRVPQLAERMGNAAFVASNREYTTYRGELNGQPVLAVSHGIGGPSTAICIEELAKCGITTIIRTGTCGGMHLPVKGGDLVIAHAAIRQEGTSLHYLPIEFPAVSDFEVTAALIQAAREQGVPYHVGVVQCKDSFYGQLDPDSSPVAYELKNKWKSWIQGKCLASEMETATLYTVGAVRGIRTGCVLQVLWNQERQAANLPDPLAGKVTTEVAVETAIRAVELLIQQDQQ